MKVLVVNAGSSSLKYQFMDTATGEVLGKGICERIGMAGSLIEHKKADGTKIRHNIAMPDHSVATEIVVKTLTDEKDGCRSLREGSFRSLCRHICCRWGWIR